MHHRIHFPSTARLQRLPQTLWNLAWAGGLALLALPLIFCALVPVLRVRIR